MSLDVNNVGRSAQATGGAAVTPSDATVLRVTKALWIGTAGDLIVRFHDGSIATHKVPQGVFPAHVTQVRAGTTAADIVAWY